MADVQLIHPGLGPDHIITVPEESQLPHFQAGWRVLADDELPAQAQPETPPPMTRAQAAKTAAKAASSGEGNPS